MRKSAAVIADLVLSGLTAEQIALVAELAATAAVEGSGVRPKSVGALRTERWRERHKTSQNVTEPSPRDASLTVTNRHKPSHRDASRVENNLLLDSLDSVEDTPEAKASSVSQTTKKTRRCPPSWLPNSTTLIAIDATTFTAGEIERELAKFRDHQYRDAHTDWDAAFRNWIRTADERRPQNANGHSAKFVARQANFERSQRGFDAAVRYREARDG